MYIYHGSKFGNSRDHDVAWRDTHGVDRHRLNARHGDDVRCVSILVLSVLKAQCPTKLARSKSCSEKKNKQGETELYEKWHRKLEM